MCGGQLSGTRDFVPGLSGQGLRVPETSLKTWSRLGICQNCGPFPGLHGPQKDEVIVSKPVTGSHARSASGTVPGARQNQVWSPAAPPPCLQPGAGTGVPSGCLEGRVVRAEDGRPGPGSPEEVVVSWDPA